MTTKDVFTLTYKKAWFIAVGGFISILLHNFLSGFFDKEEIFFFTLVVFVLPAYTLVALIFTLIHYRRQK